MIRSINKDVTAAANTEALETFVTGKAGVKRVIKFIWFEFVTGVDLRGYIDQDRIVDVDAESYNQISRAVQVEAELADGQEFKAGWNNTTGGSITQHITVFYSEDEG